MIFGTCMKNTNKHNRDHSVRLHSGINIWNPILCKNVNFFICNFKKMCKKVFFVFDDNDLPQKQQTWS